MKIWIVNHEFPPLGQGGATACAMLSRTMAQRGHEVTVFTSGWEHLPRAEETDGYTVIRVDVHRKRKERSTPLEMLSFIRGAGRVALQKSRTGVPDGVIAFFAFPSGLVAKRLARKHAVPYVISARGHDVPGFLPHRYKWHHRVLMPILRSVWNEATFVVANSHSLETRLRRLNCIRSPIRMISNGVDARAFSPNGHPGREPNVFRVLFVGRLTEQKGLLYLFKSLAALPREGRPVFLRLAGEGELRTSLEAWAVRLGLKNVTFLGRLAHGDVLSEYRRTDLFVLPSLDEGMSNALLEAMACGLPVLATDAGDNARLVEPGVHGLIVPPGDASALGEALQKLRCDPDACRRMGEAGRRRVQARTWEAVARQYVELFEEVPVCRRN